MVKISFDDGVLKIKGHANTAPHGQDLVCASVSFVAQAFKLANKDWINVKRETPGKLEYKLLEPDNPIQKVAMIGTIQMLKVGLEALAQDYPENVEVTVWNM